MREQPITVAMVPDCQKVYAGQFWLPLARRGYGFTDGAHSLDRPYPEADPPEFSSRYLMPGQLDGAHNDKCGQLGVGG